MNKALSIRRREKDIFKLRSADYQVTETDQLSTYHVEFKGTSIAIKVPKIQLMKKASGPSTSTSPKSTPTKVLLSAFSTKYSIPTSTTGKYYKT